jgi:hypothetical protein
MNRKPKSRRAARRPQALNPLSCHQIQARRYRRVTLAQAQQMLPMVRRLTEAAMEQTRPLADRLHLMVPADPRNLAVQQAYEQVVRHWAGKVERLGLKVFGLGQVGFDGGQGWYCWQSPQRSIRYFLEYHAPFETRCLLQAHFRDEFRQTLRAR